MGFNQLSSKFHNLPIEDDLSNIAINKAMGEDRSDSVMKYLHFFPNSELHKNDNYLKFHSLITLSQSKSVGHFIPVEDISDDKYMAQYFGKYSCKQSI